MHLFDNLRVLKVKTLFAQKMRIITYSTICKILLLNFNLVDQMANFSIFYQNPSTSDRCMRVLIVNN